MLSINDETLIKRAEIIREKGTNRSQFFRGEVDKYGWVDIGSSFLPSEIIAAFLYAQIENLETIQNKRKFIWETYYNGIHQWAKNNNIGLPEIPDYATNNAHMFYLDCKNIQNRTLFINHLKSNGIQAVFHYLSLHKSPFYKEKHDGRELPNCDKFSDSLVRLPFFYELSEQQLQKVINTINTFQVTLSNP